MVKYKNIRIEVRRTLHTQTKVVHKLGNELDVPISLAEYLGYVPWSTQCEGTTYTWNNIFSDIMAIVKLKLCRSVPLIFETCTSREARML